MTRSLRDNGLLCWAILAFVLLALPAHAQETSGHDDILRLVPPDTGLCLLVNNLREHSEALRGSSWLKALRGSPLGRQLVESTEWQQLVAKIEHDLPEHLGVTWPELRDDILGDLVVLAYRPGQPQEEEGLLLLRARKPEVLAKLIDRINDVQMRANQLKEVKTIPYLGENYVRRSEAAKNNYYYLHGSLLAFSSKESLVQAVIERQQQAGKSTPRLLQHIQRTRAERALVTVWLNPRAFDAELLKKVKSHAPEAQVLEQFVGYWKALDAVVVTAQVADAIEVKLSLQARPQDLPKSARRLFSDKPGRSELWSRFPSDAILRIACRLDAEALADSVTELTPPKQRSKVTEDSQRFVGAFLGLDLAKDILPNLGPDVGMCVLAGADNSDLPQVLAALAVKPGKAAADQALYKGAQFLAGLLIFAYNSSHTDAIRLETKVMDGTEIKFLSNDKAFPAGFRPAFALKDGYFLLASAPDAMRAFKPTASTIVPGADNPIAKLSLKQLSKFMKVRRAKVIAHIADKNHIDKAVAEQWLDGMLSALDLFNQFVLSERREAGQVTWSVRLIP